MKKSLVITASSAALAACTAYLLLSPLARPATAADTQNASKSQHSFKSEDNKVGEIYKFKAKSLDGKEIDLSKYKGDVILIVNTASQCGYTPQYKGLEELNKKYAARGLKVLGFPCNQFGAQEPGDSKEISTFCTQNYGVDFQMFEKIDVNGKEASPIYQYLTSETANQPIKWNFTKFLIDRKGKLVKRFESNVEPKDLDGDIEKLL